MKVLLAEDSQRLLRSLGQGLQKLGYAVDESKQGTNPLPSFNR